MRVMKKFLFALVFAAGCTGGDGMNSGTVNGRVTDDASFAPVSGATVVAFEVESDGSLTAVSDSVTTDVNGSYRVEVTFEASSISDLVVEATGSGSFEGRAIVSAEITDGSTVSAPPISGESTVEADIYVEARSSFDAHTTSEGLRGMIDSQVTAAVQASAEYQQDVQDLAVSIAAGLKARARMLVHSSIGFTEAQVQAFLRAEAEAQADLDHALHIATSQAQIDAAVSAYVSAMATARSDLGLSEFSQSVQAQVTAALSTSASLSSNVASQARVRFERLKAQALADANEAAFTALGASSLVMTGLNDARVQLYAAIEASGGAQASINNAWVSYNGYVRGELKTQVESVRSGGSAAIDTVQTSVTTSRTTLQSALTAAAGNVDAIVTAYASFMAAVDASVRGDATLNQMTSAQVDATIGVLAILNLNG